MPDDCPLCEGTCQVVRLTDRNRWQSAVVDACPECARRSLEHEALRQEYFERKRRWHETRMGDQER